MTAVRMTKYLILLIATGLLAFAISGANQTIVLFIGYLLLGVSLPVLILHRGQETLSVFTWVAILLIFAFVFDSDRMMTPDYQLSTSGTALLWAAPIVGCVLRLAFWVIDRLRLKSEVAARAAGRHPESLKPGAMARTNHPAYPWLIACWLLWPVCTALIAMSDETRWDRMRYNNSLLMWMFLPPIIVTLGFLIYRHWRERKTEIDTPV